jgi:hypothetical protein
MTEAESKNDRAELTKLMRSIAREVAYEALDEHLEEFEHKQKNLDATEMEG